jgi:hypothetical protein
MSYDLARFALYSVRCSLFLSQPLGEFNMQTLKLLASHSRNLGYRRGESAAEFAKRSPDAAKALSNFIKVNHSALVREVAGRV